jgi:hypothetical protein
MIQRCGSEVSHYHHMPSLAARSEVEAIVLHIDVRVDSTRSPDGGPLNSSELSGKLKMDRRSNRSKPMEIVV